MPLTGGVGNCTRVPVSASLHATEPLRPFPPCLHTACTDLSLQPAGRPLAPPDTGCQGQDSGCGSGRMVTVAAGYESFLCPDYDGHRHCRAMRYVVPGTPANGRPPRARSRSRRGGRTSSRTPPEAPPPSPGRAGSKAPSSSWSWTCTGLSVSWQGGTAVSANQSEVLMTHRLPFIKEPAPLHWVSFTLPPWQRHGFFLSSQLLHIKGHEHSVLSSDSRHRLRGGEGFGEGIVSRERGGQWFVRATFGGRRGGH